MGHRIVAGGTKAAAAAGAILLLSASPLWAQPAANEGPHIFRATRIPAHQAPVIDGNLSDPAWAKSRVLDDLRQVDPDPGARATERTTVRVLYDAHDLYIGVHCYDDQPNRVIVRTQARDGNLSTGDYIRIYLDPGLTRRNGYVFDVGPNGARTDSLLQNNTTLLTEWNAIWSASARRTKDGWEAEIAIPFQSLSYNPNNPRWGFDIMRSIRRKVERDRWTSHLEAIAQEDISQEGELTGLTGIGQGLGLDLQVYGRIGYKHDWGSTNAHGALSGAPSANAYYKIAQALTGTLTINPDFSDAPLDPRQVNTTRFSLFTPETRDFFLQDAQSFEFGGLAFSNSNNARPFFSRNIGLLNGRPVTLLGGGKISGQYDGLGIGALSVVTNKTATTASQVLSAVRVTAPVLNESHVGFIVTHGDPTGLTQNTVAGGDFQYRNSHVMGDNILQTDVYYERSFSSAVGDDDSFGGVFNYPNEPWGGQLLFEQIGTHFDPALGFVNRPGIRDYEGTLTHITRFHDQYLRYVQESADEVLVTGLNNELQSRKGTYYIKFSNHTADVLQGYIYDYYENVPAAFNLPRGVPVPAGKYGWTNFGAKIDTTMGRPVVFTWQVECCRFYNGSYFSSDLTLIFRPNYYFEIIPEWQAQWIHLPTGYVAVHILSLNAAVNFTPDMQLAIQAQFDNISRGFGLSMRYRWEYKPGDELFVAFGQSAVVPGTTFRAQTSQFSIRLGHTFRF